MSRTAGIFAALFLAFPAWSAEQYALFVHSRGDYALEYPAGWSLSEAAEAATIRPPGEDGRYVRVTIDRYPAGSGSPQTRSAYEKALVAQAKGVKKLLSRRRIRVSGRLASRLTFVETATLKGENGQALPGPMREIFIVTPFSREYYYVLRLGGMGKAYEKALPQFERMVSQLKFHVKAPRR